MLQKHNWNTEGTESENKIEEIFEELMPELFTINDIPLHIQKTQTTTSRTETTTTTTTTTKQRTNNKLTHLGILY